MHDLLQPGAGARATRRAVELVLIAVALLLPAAPAHADSRQVYNRVTHHHSHSTLDVWLGGEDSDSDEPGGEHTGETAGPGDQTPATGAQPAAPGDQPADDAPAGPAGPVQAPAVTVDELPLVGRTVAVPVACPAAAAQDCTGTLTIKAFASEAKAAAVRASRRGRKLVRISRRGRKLTLGRSSFTVRRGRTLKVGVRISRRGRRLVNARSSLHVDVGLVTRDGSGSTHRSHKTVTLRSAGRSARHTR